MCFWCSITTDGRCQSQKACPPAIVSPGYRQAALSSGTCILLRLISSLSGCSGSVALCYYMPTATMTHAHSSCL